MSGNGGSFTIHQVWKPNSKYWEHETISQTLDLTLKLLNPHHLKRHEIILHGKTHSCVDSLWLSACFIATSQSGNRKWSSLKRPQPQEIFETVAKHCWENKCRCCFSCCVWVPNSLWAWGGGLKVFPSDLYLRSYTQSLFLRSLMKVFAEFLGGSFRYLFRASSSRSYLLNISQSQWLRLFPEGVSLGSFHWVFVWGLSWRSTLRSFLKVFPWCLSVRSFVALCLWSFIEVFAWCFLSSLSYKSLNVSPSGVCGAHFPRRSLGLLSGGLPLTLSWKSLLKVCPTGFNLPIWHLPSSFA